MPKIAEEHTIKERRGQFFTTSLAVQNAMISLLEHDDMAKCLEPSAGAGNLVEALEKIGYLNIDAVEFDDSINQICSTDITYDSFFHYAANHDNEYDIIFGNPPYVAWKNLEKEQRNDIDVLKVKDQRYSDKCNFYFLFIDRCIDLLTNGGELVFIVPKEWLYSTSAVPLRDKMLANGSLTHIINIDEEKVFDDAMPPATIIFRYVKGKVGNDKVKIADSINAAEHNEWSDKKIVNLGSRWGIFDSTIAEELGDDWIRFGDLYIPRVGIVSGADPIFRCNDEISGTGIVPYVTTKGIERFIDPTGYELNELCDYARNRLIDNESKLRSRRIMKITDKNWFRYGAVRNREVMLSDAERFYVKNRTRDTKPFFDDTEAKQQNAVLYSGGILGLFRSPTAPSCMNKADIIEYLNSDLASRIFEAMGITTGTKKTFLPSLVEEIPVPRKVVYGN